MSYCLKCINMQLQLCCLARHCMLVVCSLSVIARSSCSQLRSQLSVKICFCLVLFTSVHTLIMSSQLYSQLVTWQVGSQLCYKRSKILYVAMHDNYNCVRCLYQCASAGSQLGSVELNMPNQFIYSYSQLLILCVGVDAIIIAKL